MAISLSLLSSERLHARAPGCAQQALITAVAFDALMILTAALLATYYFTGRPLIPNRVFSHLLPFAGGLFLVDGVALLVHALLGKKKEAQVDSKQPLPLGREEILSVHSSSSEEERQSARSTALENGVHGAVSESDGEGTASVHSSSSEEERQSARSTALENGVHGAVSESDGEGTASVHSSSSEEEHQSARSTALENGVHGAVSESDGEETASARSSASEANSMNASLDRLLQLPESSRQTLSKEMANGEAEESHARVAADEAYAQENAEALAQLWAKVDELKEGHKSMFAVFNRHLEQWELQDKASSPGQEG